jgi:hypothetical protein
MGGNSGDRKQEQGASADNQHDYCGHNNAVGDGQSETDLDLHTFRLGIFFC